MNGIPVNRDSLYQGTYQIRITDSTFCETVDTVILTNQNQLLNTITTLDPSCNGFLNGTIDVQTSGGNAPYTYLWSNGDTSQNISNISSGVYSVMISDLNNCILYDTVFIDQPLSLTYSEIHDSVSCFGFNDGFIDLSINGGTAPYSFNWSSGDTTEDLYNLSFGTYDVDVTDSNNCLLVVNFNIYQPDELLTSYILNYVSCYGLRDGSIDASISGGTSPYNYSWNTGDSIQDLNNISASTYILNVTDQNNCSVVDTIEILEPDELVASLTDTNGTLVSIGTGGTTPYTYDVYDANGIFATTSNNMGVSFTINPVLNGLYTLVVTDANGCVDSSQVTITASSIFENGTLDKIKLYPNPSRSIFNLSFFNSVKQDIDISVYSLLGEKVYKEFINCLLYTSPSPRDATLYRMPSSA